MMRVPCVAIVIENARGEILLLLRDNHPGIACPNQWTLIGGKVEDGETPEMAARRELAEETGLKADLSFWKRYDRLAPALIVDQYVYTAKLDVSRDAITLGEGRDIRFFKSHDVQYLKIGFEFGPLLNEYLQLHHP